MRVPDRHGGGVETWLIVRARGKLGFAGLSPKSGLNADNDVPFERRCIGLDRRFSGFREKFQSRNMEEAAGFVPGVRMYPRRNDLHQRQEDQEERTRKTDGHELIR